MSVQPVLAPTGLVSNGNGIETSGHVDDISILEVFKAHHRRCMVPLTIVVLRTSAKIFKASILPTLLGGI